MAASLAVLVPGQARETLDGADPLHEPLRSDLAEMLTERIARLVSVTEDPSEGEKALIVHQAREDDRTLP